MVDWDEQEVAADLDVAIIGMAGRFPGAKNIAQFWRNLCDGVESISFFSEDELAEAGENPGVLRHPNYVKARGILDNVEMFDAAFFGFYPREAEALDPQQRLFLECAWEALEDAGYHADAYDGAIGVFGGVGMNTYLLTYLAANGKGGDPAELYQLAIANDKDFLATRVSYKLNLTGPSIDVQSACSTSLVAVHLACQNLLNYQCDMALAGGVSIMLPQKRGYIFQDGMILSPDGHCRPFAANAAGTLSGNGAGIVVLKRLTDALADGDHIYAVIKGSAVNNDGAVRVGYTAPGIDGQAQVIAMAQTMAGVEPETIGYIEAHGTGTAMGDPIEVSALTQVFREKTEAKRFCAIGSVKSNLGHLDAAAGVAGLIKTALALKHKVIPPTLHFEKPNPQIDFENSPFYVNTTLAEWQSGTTRRRAGVSSFGIGGTNAHVVLEEAPSPAPAAFQARHSRPWQLLLLSARSNAALEQATANLAAHLDSHPGLDLADVAYTLQTGRKPLNHRRAILCRSREEALAMLEQRDPRHFFAGQIEVAQGQNANNPPLVFMFSGQGAQYVNMGRELYEVEPAFRQQVDYCAEFLKPHLGLDLRHLLYPSEPDAAVAQEQLNQTRVTQPALFVIEYALAHLLTAWGLQPQAMIGHSIGEYVAACLAGVLSLEEALTLVATRGRLMNALPGGAMLSVFLSEDDIQPWLDGQVALAAVNGSATSVVSGPHRAIDALEEQLSAKGVAFRRLHTSHAFHSRMMEPVLAAFTAAVKKVKLNAPAIPYVSNVTGTWITAAEATDPGYYARHLRETVRFADGIGTLLQEPGHIFIEVGPGQTLNTLARRHPDQAAARAILNSLRHPNEQQSDVTFLLTTLGKLWLSDATIDWSGFYAQERRRRVSLPTYPFERQRYWLDVKTAAAEPHEPEPAASQKRDVADWFYVPSWKRADLPKPFGANGFVAEKTTWLLFVDEYGLGAQMAAHLAQKGQDVITVRPGQDFAPVNGQSYALNPQARDGYERLLQELAQRDQLPERIVHFWSVTPDNQSQGRSGSFAEVQALGFYSLLYLAQAVGKLGITTPLQLGIVSTNLQDVTGEENLCPARATLSGLCQVIPQEHPHITCRSVDVAFPGGNGLPSTKTIRNLVAEFTAGSLAATVAYRRTHRWVQIYEPVRLNGSETQLAARLRPGGTYLITGGLGRIGLTIARYLAQTAQATLVLVGRTALPPRGEWQQWLETHDEQDPIGRQLREVMALEETGARVLPLRADVADEQQMRRVMATIEAQFGRLHGVIHAAGVVGERSIRTIQEVSRADVAAQFQSKIHGLDVLARLLQGKQLDFCLLQSSLSAVLGGLGLAVYAAANHYMDAFARQRHQLGETSWISINWDGWRLDDQQTHRVPLSPTQSELALKPEEGITALKHVLSGDGLPQVVISTTDLQARISRWVRLESIRDKERANTATIASSARHGRPNIATAYVAPGRKLEQAIAVVWQELLGLEKVGIYDSFFDLGGDSLLGTQVVAKLRSAFQVELPLRTLFEDPTVAGVARAIEAERKAKAGATEKIAEILKKLENLTEEEAQALLAEKGVGELAESAIFVPPNQPEPPRKSL